MKIKQMTKYILLGYTLLILIVLILSSLFLIANWQLICCSEGALSNIEFGNGRLSEHQVDSSSVILASFGFTVQDVIVAILLYFNSLLVLSLLIFRQKTNWIFIGFGFLLITALFVVFGSYPEGFAYVSSIAAIPISIILFTFSWVRKVDSEERDVLYLSLMNFVFIAWSLASFIGYMLLYFD